MARLARIILLFIVLNGVFLSWAYGAKSGNSDENWVKVEKSPVVIEEKKGKKHIEFLSYKERRESWAIRFGFSAETWGGKDYPASTTDRMKLASKSIDFGLQLMGSYNLPLIAVGFGINLSSLSLEQDANVPNAASVSAIKYGADAHVILDGLIPNPYIAPYAKVGMGQISFSNPNDSDVKSHGSGFTMYYSLGAMFLLDWIQKDIAMEAYFENGIQGAFFFFEYEMFPGIQSSKDELTGKFDLSGMKFGFQLVF